MYGFIEKIRRKDKRKQESFAFFTAFTITLFIFFVWLIALVTDLSGQGGQNTASPIKVFTKQVKSIFNSTQTYEAPRVNDAEN